MPPSIPDYPEFITYIDTMCSIGSVSTLKNKKKKHERSVGTDSTKLTLDSPRSSGPVPSSRSGMSLLFATCSVQSNYAC